MNTQIVKWVKTLAPAVGYLLLHQLLGITGMETQQRVWVILPVVWLCYRREKPCKTGTLRLRSVRGMALAALTAAAAALLSASLAPLQIQPMTPGLLAATVIAGPIGEELLYRGIVFRRGVRFFGCRQAVVLSAVLFGLAHTGAVQMAAAAVFGGMLCLVRLRYEHMAAPILIHSCVNFLSGCAVFGRLPRASLAIAGLGVSGLALWLLCCAKSAEKA